MVGCSFSVAAGTGECWVPDEDQALLLAEEAVYRAQGEAQAEEAQALRAVLELAGALCCTARTELEQKEAEVEGLMSEAQECNTLTTNICWSQEELMTLNRSLVQVKEQSLLMQRQSLPVTARLRAKLHFGVEDLAKLAARRLELANQLDVDPSSGGSKDPRQTPLNPTEQQHRTTEHQIEQLNAATVRLRIECKEILAQEAREQSAAQAACAADAVQEMKLEAECQVLAGKLESFESDCRKERTALQAILLQKRQAAEEREAASEAALQELREWQATKAQNERTAQDARKRTTTLQRHEREAKNHITRLGEEVLAMEAKVDEAERACVAFKERTAASHRSAAMIVALAIVIVLIVEVETYLASAWP